MIARAYVNHGRWVAGCPREFCTNALELQPRQARFSCTTVPDGCGLDAPIEWPPDADDIWAALMRRPVPATRNWFPTGHELAVRAGCPHGQTAADLLAEGEMYGVRGVR
ncbi:hypothetical protein [Actinomadura rugatobispora]|uniref:Uncharacterized protein n=1 Tax=Actinomadura rugatobispora TaxID=1994 RepID=A0ABW0ZT23_9ACTN|nr:hypothetical protein GCM10010200_036560 [Actinomadura rugatobispora]